MESGRDGEDVGKSALRCCRYVQEDCQQRARAQGGRIYLASVVVLRSGADVSVCASLAVGCATHIFQKIGSNHRRLIVGAQLDDGGADPSLDLESDVKRI